jgi:hypothetical protein
MVCFICLTCSDTYLVQSGEDAREVEGTSTPGWEAELQHYIGMRIESFVLRQQVKPAGVSVLSASPIELLAKLERCHCDMVDMGTSRNDWKEKFQRLGIEATQQISAAKERISSLRMFNGACRKPRRTCCRRIRTDFGRPGRIGDFEATSKVLKAKCLLL